MDIIVTYRGANADRRANLRAVLRHLDRTYEDYTLWLLEADRAPTFNWGELADEKVRHVFIYDAGPFPKAKLCNMGMRLTRSAIVCLHDSDMIAPPAIMKFCVDDLLNRGATDVWCPFEHIVNVAGELREQFSATGDFSLLDPYRETHAPFATDMTLLYDSNSGGINLMRRETFQLIGGFDDRFTGWGGEDNDILCRARRLNIRWHSIAARRMFHLHHDSPSRVGWSEQPHSADNCNRANDALSLNDAEFRAHVERLRTQL